MAKYTTGVFRHESFQIYWLRITDTKMYLRIPLGANKMIPYCPAGRRGDMSQS
jgi:hypothetical protein